MKKIILGTSALVIACFLNLKYAVNDYGVIDNEQHACVLAQSNSSDGGTTDGGTTDGGTTDGGTTDGGTTGGGTTGGGTTGGGTTGGGTTGGGTTGGGTTIGDDGWDGDTSKWGDGTSGGTCGTSTSTYTSGNYRKITYTCTTSLGENRCKDGWITYQFSSNGWSETSHNYCDKSCDQF
jgi:hypothetical protein